VVNQPALGRRIRELRLLAGLSQQDLAGPGVSASYVSRLESGERHASDRCLEWLAERLGTTVGFLTAGVADDGRRELRLELATAQLALDNGDAADAAERFALLCATDDAEVAEAASWGLAASKEAIGDLGAAIEAYEELLEDALAASGRHSLIRAATALSRCYREAGDLARAVDVGELALARLRDIGVKDSDVEINLLLTIAMAYQERGDLVRTQQLLARIRRVADELGTPRARGAAYWNAGVLAGELGHKADAVFLVERALALFGEGSDERNLARLHNAHATLLMRSDPTRASDALAMLRSAHETLEVAGSEIDIAYCETEMARALTLVGDAAAGIDMALSALSRLESETRLEGARARTALAYALAAAGRGGEATAEYQAAALTLENLKAPHQAALVWAELAVVADAGGDVAGAMAATRRALRSAHLEPPFPAPSGVAAVGSPTALS
jgi:transcriptional regulator with XRE-family HTH domain